MQFWLRRINILYSATYSHQLEDILKKVENQTVAVHIDFDSIGNIVDSNCLVFHLLQNSVYV